MKMTSWQSRPRVWVVVLAGPLAATVLACSTPRPYTGYDAGLGGNTSVGGSDQGGAIGSRGGSPGSGGVPTSGTGGITSVGGMSGPGGGAGAGGEPAGSGGVMIGGGGRGGGGAFGGGGSQGGNGGGEMGSLVGGGGMDGRANGGHGGEGAAQAGTGGTAGAMVLGPMGCLIGTTSLQIGDGVMTSGDVATDAFTLGTRSLVNGNVNVFGRAMLGAMSRINGSLESSQSVSVATGAIVTGGTHVPGLAAQSRLPIVAFTEGTVEVALDSTSPHILSPGDYGAALIQARATVTIQGGVYTFTSLNVGQLANLVLENTDAITFFVQGSVMLASGISVQTTGEAPVLLYSNGSAVTVASALPASLNVVAPSANFVVTGGTNCAIGGCIGGSTVVVQAGCSVNGKSTLPSTIVGPHAN